MLLKGKRGLIFGVANDLSIAWGIARACHREGAELGFSFLNEALERRVVPLAQSLGCDYTFKCDVQSDEDIDQAFKIAEARWGKIDFVVHSLAFAGKDDLKSGFTQTSRSGFALAMDVSAYSLVALAQRAEKLMTDGGSIICLSYYGAEKVMPNYKVMGVAKAALEACTRELAVDLGPKKIRVNCISAGPVKTLAASGIPGLKKLLAQFEERAPMGEVVTTEQVGDSAVYLLSDLSSGVSGEIHYVDGGFNVTGA